MVIQIRTGACESSCGRIKKMKVHPHKVFIQFTLRSMLFAALTIGASMALASRWEAWSYATVATDCDGASISKDGKKAVIVHSAGSVQVLMIEGQYKHSELLTSIYATSAIISPSGEFLITENDEGAQLRDLRNGATLCEINIPVIRNIKTFSPQSEFLARVADADGSNIKIYKGTNCEPICTLPVDSKEICFSPDGSYLITFHHTEKKMSTKAIVWNVRTGEQKTVLEGHNNVVTRARFSHDGQRIATLDRDQVIRIWDAVSGQCKVTRQTRSCENIEWSLNDNLLATTSSTGDICFWNSSTIVPKMTLSGHQNSIIDLCYLPDGIRLVTRGYDHTLRVWNIMEGIQVAQLTNQCAVGPSFGVTADGSKIICGLSDGSCGLWRNNHREEWYMILSLVEFWIAIGSFIAFLWSILEDHIRLKKNRVVAQRVDPPLK